MLFQASVQEELKGRRFITAIKALKYLSTAYTPTVVGAKL